MQLQTGMNMQRDWIQQLDPIAASAFLPCRKHGHRKPCMHIQQLPQHPRTPCSHSLVYGPDIFYFFGIISAGIRLALQWRLTAHSLLQLWRMLFSMFSFYARVCVKYSPIASQALVKTEASVPVTANHTNNVVYVAR